MTRVKICGLTNLRDAVWAWRCGADMLGFILVPSSPRCLTPLQAAQITHALRRLGCGRDGRVRLVGVFADRDPYVVQCIARLCGLDLVQLHGNEPPEQVQRYTLPVILARRVREEVPWNDLARYQSWATLLDSYDPQRLGGSGRCWAWELAQGSREPERLILAGGLTPDNVTQAIRLCRPWGVDVSSGVEACPGRKDPARVQRFIQQVREEEQDNGDHGERNTAAGA